jgi:hypothetical protein
MTSNSDEISLKELGKKVLLICRQKKKTFMTLLIGIMVLSAAYFSKVVLKPSYKSEVVLKSKFLRKDAFVNILEYYNMSMSNNYEDIGTEVKNSLINSQIAKLESAEIKADLSSPDKDDRTKYYRFTMTHTQKPTKSLDNDFKVLLYDIKQKVAIDNDVSIGKQKTEEAINELDSLLKTALPAGDAFKNKINSGTSMLIMNDLYKSLNELLARKSGLKTEQQYFQTENLIYQVTPIVLSKKISFPLIIFFIGIGIWLLICSIWVGFVLVFSGDE